MAGPIDFPDEDNVAPAILDHPDSEEGDPKIADFIELETGVSATLTFALEVRDPNVNDDLFARWRLSQNTDSEGVRSGAQLLSDCNGETNQDLSVVAKTGEAQRPYTFLLDTARVEQLLDVDQMTGAGCFRLDLAVSGSFDIGCADVVRMIGQAPDLFDLTELPNDVGRASWLLGVRPAESTAPIRCMPDKERTVEAVAE